MHPSISSIARPIDRVQYSAGHRRLLRAQQLAMRWPDVWRRLGAGSSSGTCSGRCSGTASGRRPTTRTPSSSPSRCTAPWPSRTDIHTYIHTYRHTYIQTYRHTYIHIAKYNYIQRAHCSVAFQARPSRRAGAHTSHQALPCRNAHAGGGGGGGGAVCGALAMIITITMEHCEESFLVFEGVVIVLRASTGELPFLAVASEPESQSVPQALCGIGLSLLLVGSEDLC